jgi:hypothetical protein
MAVLRCKIANVTLGTLAWTEVFAQNALRGLSKKPTARTLARCVTLTSTALHWLRFQMHLVSIARAIRHRSKAVTSLNFAFAIVDLSNRFLLTSAQNAVQVFMTMPWTGMNVLRAVQGSILLRGEQRGQKHVKNAVQERGRKLEVRRARCVHQTPTHL